MVGGNWPYQGELDIYEGVSLQTNNQITLHTAPGCSPNVGPGGELSTRIPGTEDCGAGGAYNGCGTVASDSTSFGTGLNEGGGGIFASLWTSSGIQVWNFARANVPDDIKRGIPDPSSWGTPTANYGNGGCDFNSNFKDMNIVSVCS